jgi:aminotransferase
MSKQEASKRMIQIFSNSLGDEELAAIKRVAESRWLGKGPECDALERELAQHFGTPKALLLNCCTSAIYVSLKAHGIGAGDEVIVATANFVGVANSVIDVGAKPVFADVHPETFAILPSEIERLKTPRTRAVYLLHYGGHPAPFEEIRRAAGDKILLLEDSANAVASRYKGKRCGALGDRCHENTGHGRRRLPARARRGGLCARRGIPLPGFRRDHDLGGGRHATRARALVGI